ncbi:UNVERIFIED_CONTAM: hypothetical protein ABIE34_004243, partial [Jeotgalibacillus campisalis]
NGRIGMQATGITHEQPHLIDRRGSRTVDRQIIRHS